VEGLKEGNTYQFRVRAVNKAGPGEASEPTKPHVAKARFLKPTINREKMQKVTVRAGQNVKLDVDIKGEPPPTTTWSIGAKVVETGANCKVEHLEYNARLTLTDTSRSMTGTYTLKAVNDSGSDEATVEICILDKPGKPEGPLEAFDVHKEGCKLKWKKPKDDGGLPITNYVVEKMDVTTGKWVPAGNVDPENPEIEIKGLEPMKKYNFRVKAVNEEGESEPLETDTSILAKNPFDVPAIPGMPDIVDWDQNMVKLKWDPPIRDGGAPITGYIIECKDKNSGGLDFVKCAEVHGNVCAGTVPKLEEGNVYQFRVRAVNKAGPSEASEATNPHIAKARNLAPKIDRTNLDAITVKVGQQVSLDVNIIGEPPPKVTWTFKEKELVSDEAIRIDNIDYNTKLFVMRAKRPQSGTYIITASNVNGEDKAEVEITIIGKPSKPKGPLEVADITKNGCKLKWKKPEDDGGVPVEYYEIEKLDPLTGQWLPCGTSKDPEANITGLQEGKPYKFRVKAVNKEGESEELETEKPIIAKNPFDEPGKPGKPELKNWDKDFVDLEWTPPKSDGGAPIEKYVIQMRDKEGRAWVDACTAPGDRNVARVTNVEPGHEYEFRIVAQNKAGKGEPSDPSKSVICKPRFLAPRIDRKNLLKKTIHCGQLLIIEADVQGEPPAEIVWLLKEQPLKSADRLTIENEDYKTKFTLTKCKRSDTGIYKVTAKNNSGADQVDVEICVLSAPGKPKGPLKVSDVTAEGVKLKWEKPEDDGGVPIDHYVVERMDTDTGRWVPVTTTKVPEAEVDGLNEGKEYLFRVKAVNVEGESEPLVTELPTVAKNPYNEPDKPGKPDVKDWGRNFADLKWAAPKNDGGSPITSYIIEKKDEYSSKWQKAIEIIGNKCDAKIPDLVEGMKYQFRVRACNKAGQSKPSDPSETILAKDRFAAPKIDRTNLKDMSIKAGQPIRLDVKISGEPPPSKSWFCNKARLETKDNITVDVEDYRTKLIINGVTRAHSGTFVIKAENNSGKDEASFEVTVLDRPGKPEGPLRINDIHKEGCSLKWNPPMDDGGCPLEGYVVEKMDTEKGRWVPVGRCKEPKMDIENLEPGQEYKFRVMAVNAEGESEPLDALEPIIAKNPYDEPGAPGKPEATDWDRDHVDLKWAPPEKDGGSPITGYVIEKKEKGGNKWVKCGESKGPECSGRAKDLEEGQTYEFRVRAVNLAGPGEASEASKPITARPRKLAPKIDRKTLRNINVREGEPIFLDVKIAGEPAPDITWSMNGKSFKQSNAKRIEDVPYNSRFFIDKPLRADTGVYKIQAVNQYGSDSEEVEITIISKPGAPEGPLEVSDIHKDGCKLKWKKPKDDGGEPIESYLVEKFDPDTGIWLPVGNSSLPEMEVTGLTPGHEYQFRVRACNKEGVSEPLETLSPIVARDPFTVPDAPGAPEPVDWSQTHADLVWKDPPSDGGSPILGYIVEKKDKYSSMWEKALETNNALPQAVVHNLIEGNEYQFRVIAFNKAGQSEPSDASKTFLAKARYLPPRIDRKHLRDITISAGSTLKYEAAIIGEPPPSVEWRDPGGPLRPSKRINIDNVDYNTKLIIRPAARGDSGEYTVIATNNSGKDSVTVLVTVTDKPTSPEGPLQISDVHKEGCKLKWKRPKDDGGVPIDYYQVEKLDPDTNTWVPCGRSNEPQMEVTGLTPGKEYKFRVAAVNSEGESTPLVAEQSIIAKNAFDEPGKPGELKAVDWDKDFVALEWKAPKEDGGSPITGYIVEKKDKFGNWEKALEVPGDKCAAKVPDLIEGLAYEFRVRAVNAAGPGEASDTTPPIITKPRNLAPKIDRSKLHEVRIKAGLNFSFDVPVSGEPAPVTKWMLRGKEQKSNERVKIQHPEYNTKLNVRNATREESGTWTIVAENVNGKDEAEVIVIILDKPSPPGGPLKVSDITAEGCKLSWNPPADDGGQPIDKYVVEKMDEATGRWVPAGETDGPVTSLAIDGLQPGHKYKFRVRACNKQGKSEPLATAQAIEAKNPFGKYVDR
jgi:predicted phage tail protein